MQELRVPARRIFASDLISASKPHTTYSRPFHIRPRQHRRRHFGTFAHHRAESLQPQTLYDFFPVTLPSGPPPHGPFTIDLRALRREFLEKQSAAHPDHHSGADKTKAEALSARINEAYKTLTDPLLRTQYILSLQGIDVANDETAKVNDEALLMGVMEAREVIENAVNEEDLAEVTAENENALAQSLSILDKAFQEQDWEAAKSEAVKLRYWVNIRQSIEAFEPGKPLPPLVH